MTTRVINHTRPESNPVDSATKEAVRLSPKLLDRVQQSGPGDTCPPIGPAKEFVGG